MMDFGNTTPEGFIPPEDTLSFDTLENQFLTPPSSGLYLHNNEYTQTPASMTGSSFGTGFGTSSDTTVSRTVTTRRNKPVPRKGHIKSRRGCYTCKRRKVKCSEKLPECDNCTRIGLVCEYPEPPNPSALSRLVTRSGPGGPRASRRDDPPTAAAMVLSTAPSPTTSPSLTPTFTMENLRFFHHFLVASYPPLPVQADSVWNNVAALSHGDNRFASILILAFQASCLPDGMTEFLSMIRLCSVIADAGENSNFQDLAKQGYSDSMKKMTAKTKAEVERKGFVLKPEQERLVEGFLESLGRLRVGRTVVMEGEEKEDLQMRILEGLQGAARKGRILLLHFFLMEFALGDLSLGTFRSRFIFRRKVCFAWLNEVARRIPKTAEYAELIEWPLEFGRTVFARREPT
ncbi:hypothetical protein B0T09DRAFT_357936 [Sordaria sp. MPI-SDFR-AT-0083]|nr:hypothetical protein B0T09DRAFT_357936 [Sordaria sp. MPI-SDFR-AT-0083]